jgi:hypothetical protein
MCDAAHPMRYRDPASGFMVTGYCAGESEHDREIGWEIRPERDDLFASLNEAWAELADRITLDA